ncbi:hypothetical protein [Aneurinibacillus migulanus]|uniref:hypothetical protein n=1 Tax=Aneurinibacillus migulanus TaxID=47500 RepID=UPI000A4CD5B8|nr:hypothetical protein [Aneurinibacillus migulanus]MCP1354110.1 hypothetical protein [Aneurinibacillus migulanus]MED4728093.1 hypothetical protein [Aneurinibacillus migulanus]
MWKCPYCGSEHGMPYQDSNLTGMLCLGEMCGRFHAMTEEESKQVERHVYESDM